jgi:thioesterase domain-containing protein/acyl carrier protein
MAGIWAEVLELPEVGIDDDFFALGGDSITALFVVDRVADEFACTIQPTAVRRAPTIAKLMNLLGIGRTDPRFTVLREPAGAAAGRTLYCLHATAGEVEAYRTLTDDVDETWGVIIVESDPATELATLAALGEQYARDIAGREKGDVALLGWSMGGVLAMEVARALEAMGRRVSFVALWDAYVKIAVPMEGVVGMLNAVGPAAAPLRRLDRSVQERAAAEVLRAPDSDRIAVALAIAERNGLVTEAARKTLAQRAALHRAHVRMMETHTPSGRLVAPVRVWCAKESARIADPAAWNAYAADVRVEVVDGGHFTMFLPPHGAALAKRLETALASAIDAR